MRAIQAGAVGDRLLPNLSQIASLREKSAAVRFTSFRLADLQSAPHLAKEGALTGNRHLMLVKTESHFADLLERIENRTATVGVCGMGYVGLPLGATAATAGFKVIGFDIDEAKAKSLNAGKSYIAAVRSEDLKRLLDEAAFRASSDFSQLASCDVIIICVPTPLSKQREPDLSYVTATTRTIAQNLRQGQLIVLESTTYPGTTAEVVKPILEKTGLTSGEDFLLGFSPEREDPGNTEFNTVSIPKIAAGEGELASHIINRFYSSFVGKVVSVSSTQTAEAVKLTENIFRAVNIALVNELKTVFDAMEIDIWEVIDAAKTKPFGYMPFYPGPGLGGHCIPIDPFYLTWKAREYELSTRFIELAGEVNLSMPPYVIDKLAQAIDERQSVPLSRAHVLIIGVAYKKNVPDMRESPALKLIELLEGRRAKTDFHDPLVPVIPPSRNHGQLAGRRSVDLEAHRVAQYSAVLVATDHDAVDYGLIAKHARLIIDTRNVLARRGLFSAKVVKA
jgi:UDP-N-acetyl-D-glucosamine dehydrogenase